jgi:hypothetical protein
MVPTFTAILQRDKAAKLPCASIVPATFMFVIFNDPKGLVKETNSINPSTLMFVIVLDILPKLVTISMANAFILEGIITFRHVVFTGVEKNQSPLMSV